MSPYRKLTAITSPIRFSRVTSPVTVGEVRRSGVVRNPAYQILVKTDNAGTSTDTQFTLPATGTYNIDWGDGTVESKTNAATHTYSSAGNYVIKVTGGLTQIRFSNGGDRLKLLEVQNWGDVTWSSFREAYLGCANCLFNATDTLVLPADCSTAFQGCTAFNQSVANFNTDAVTSMLQMFTSCTNFNQSVANFNTDAVTSMHAMFAVCPAFNQSVANFNTDAVTDMSAMFYGCTAFNQSVAHFNTAKVTNMFAMFTNCATFNQSVANFNTAKVTSMLQMFFGCPNFKQSVATFSLAGLNATSSLSFFAPNTNINAASTTTNYDATLIAWAAQLPLAHGLAQSPHFGTAKYSAGAAADAKAALVAAGWTFTDGGEAV